MNEYSYEGPVLYFDDCCDPHWKSKTFAVSVAQARSNLIYQWKRRHGYSLKSKISLPEPIKIVRTGIMANGEQLSMILEEDNHEHI